MSVIVPINPMPDGSCRTLKYQYYKTSMANFEKTGTWGATGVALIESEEEKNDLETMETQEEFIKKVKIRKLLPEETFVLQGMTVEDCQKCKDVGLSDSALYKISGNGLTSNVVALIMQHLHKALDDETYICYDENFQ